MSTATYEVTGMTCSHCVGSVTSEVQKVPGVTAVSVDLDTGRLEVGSEEGIDDAAVLGAVEEAGYAASRV